MLTKSKNKVRWFIILFLLITTLVGDIFLSQRIENHTIVLREHIKSVTENQRYERYKGYNQINEIKSDYTGYRVYTFATTLFVVFCLVVCERRQREYHDAK